MKPSIEDGQTIQWQKRKGKKGTKHFQQNTTQKTKDRGTQTKMETQTFCL